jgi:DNA replication protein DnaC
MDFMGEVMKIISSKPEPPTEVERYICEGCGNEVVVVDAPILIGPEKGVIKRMKRGCICWELEQARATKTEHKTGKSTQKAKQLERYDMVNPKVEKATFVSYEPGGNKLLQAALAKSLSYADAFQLDEPSNLVFYGGYGVGKSHLAYAICKVLKAKGHSAIFVSMPKLLTMLRDSYNGHDRSRLHALPGELPSASEADMLRVLSKVDLLVIDDIGAQKSQGRSDGESWANEKLFEIVDGRAGRHTVFTTNLDPNSLRQIVGERNFSRMMDKATLCKLEGEDYRTRHLH